MDKINANNYEQTRINQSQSDIFNYSPSNFFFIKEVNNESGKNLKGLNSVKRRMEKIKIRIKKEKKCIL